MNSSVRSPITVIIAVFVVHFNVVASALFPLHSSISNSGSDSTAQFYLLAAANMAAIPATDNNLVNLYELNYSTENGSLQAVSLTGWNISQPASFAGLGSFYTADVEENIYMLSAAPPPKDGSCCTENLSSYSVHSNETHEIFTNQSMPGNVSDYACARYDQSTRTAYAIAFSPTSMGHSTVRIIALSATQGFAAPSQPIFEINATGWLAGVTCALIPADFSETSTALFSFVFLGQPETTQLYTISVNSTVGVLYASPVTSTAAEIITMEPTLVKNSAGNPSLFYLAITPQLQCNFGTIDIMTGLSDILHPSMPYYDLSADTLIAFEPRANTPVLAFAGPASAVESPGLWMVWWITVGIQQTQQGGDYDKIIYINSGNFTIRAQDQAPSLCGMFTVNNYSHLVGEDF